MSMTIKRKLIAGFGVLVLMSGFFGVIVLNNMADVQDQFTYVVEHDAPVIANANRLLKLVVDMESGQRGFCITQQEEFLEPYNIARFEFHELLEAEKKLVSDNPSQIEALERIYDLVEQWQEKAAKPEIAMARKVSTHVVDARHLQDVLRRGTGKALMDRIMALGHEIEVSFSGRGDWEGAYAVEIIEKCMADREDGQRGFLITGQEAFLEKYTAGEQKKLPEYFARLRAVITKRGRDDELSERVNQLEQLTWDWTKKAAEPEIAARRQMNEHPESLEDVAALLKAGTGKALLDEIRAKFSTFINVEHELTAQRYSAASQTTLNTRRITLLMVIASVLFGSTVAVLVIRAIVSSLRKLVEGTNLVGAGDLEHRIEISSGDELGALAVAFNHMVDRRQQAECQLNQEIIHRKQAEDDLIATNVDLNQQTTLAHQMASRADAANKAKSEFLARMSHELRTPMNAIVGFSDILVDEDLAKNHKADVIVIRDSAHSLLHLINDVLDYSKIEAGQLDVDVVECRLGKLLNSLESMMKLQADEKSLDLRIMADKDVPAQIQSDPYRLRQCLTNLLNNALKFTDQGHVQLTVSLHEDNLKHFLRFDVEDTGIGIPKDQQQAVFESFTQVDGSTTRKYGGTGLGLAVTSQLAKLLGGELSLTSEPGKGSVFSLVIPTGADIAGQPLLDLNKVRGQEEEGARKTGVTLFSGKVLVAEDVEGSQKLMKSMLSKLGVDVVIAGDGHQAIQEASSQSFDLILMDMQMPHKNGYEAARILRQQGCKTPIVALTAHAMKGDDQKCIDAGCDGYMTKPLDRRELPRILAKYLPAQPEATHTTMDPVTAPADESDQLGSKRNLSEAPWSESNNTDDISAIINWDRLIESLGDEETVREIMPAYLRDIPEHFEKLSQAVKSRDCASIASHAHALKGIGSNLGIERLCDIANQVEWAGRGNDIEASTLHFNVLRTEVEKVLTVLSQCGWIEQAKKV